MSHIGHHHSFFLLNNCHKKFGKEKKGNRLKKIYRKNSQTYKKNLQKKTVKIMMIKKYKKRA